MRSINKIVIGVIAGVTVSASAASFAASSSSTTYTGCYRRGPVASEVRIVGLPGLPVSCPSSFVAFAFNEQGVPGTIGPSGASGPTGAVGPSGATGPNGANGEQGPAGVPGLKGDKGEKGDPAPATSPTPSAFRNYTLESTDRAPNGCALARPAGTDPFIVTYVATQQSMALYLGPTCEGLPVVPSLSFYGGGNTPLSETFSPGFVVPAGSALSIRSSGGGHSWINGYIAPSN